MIAGLPEKLKKHRERYGFSQRKVSKLLGVSHNTVSAYESGSRTPSPVMLLKLSRLYNCSIDYLLGNDNNELITIDMNTLSKAHRDILLSLLRLSKEESEE